jgi:DNA polymerase I
MRLGRPFSGKRSQPGSRRHCLSRCDRSDKIPGAKGIGEKAAASLLHKYGSLESVIAAGRFAAQAENLLLYKSVATMDKSAPLPVLRNQKPTWAKASLLARYWELNQLAKRLSAPAKM